MTNLETIVDLMRKTTRLLQTGGRHAVLSLAPDFEDAFFLILETKTPEGRTFPITEWYRTEVELIAFLEYAVRQLEDEGLNFTFGNPYNWDQSQNLTLSSTPFQKNWNVFSQKTNLSNQFDEWIKK